MYISIIKVVNNRVAKYAEKATLEEAQAHCAEYGGFVYEGDYREDLWVDGEVVSIVTLPIKVPEVVTMRQARLALLQVGLLSNVEAAINSLASPQKEAAQIEWEYSQEVQRDKELVALLAPALGLNDAQLDALFVLAATL